MDVPGDIEEMNQQSLPKAAAMLQEKKHKGKSQEEKKMAGTGITGMLITFVGGIILIMVLVIVLILYHKRQVERTSAPFPQVIQDAAVMAVPETEDFDKFLVRGIKDAGQSLKGYERIQSGYDSLPNYIICYRGNEMYILTAKYSSRRRIDVDTERILHFTKEQIKEIKIGMGKVDIIFKNKMFFVAAVSPNLIAPQTEQYGGFMKYIKNLAAEVKA